MDSLGALQDWLVNNSDKIREIAKTLNIPVNDFIQTMLDDALESYMNFAELQKSNGNK